MPGKIKEFADADSLRFCVAVFFWSNGELYLEIRSAFKTAEKTFSNKRDYPSPKFLKKILNMCTHEKYFRRIPLERSELQNLK